MNFSPQQIDALRAVRAWLAKPDHDGDGQVFRLFGFAGTGKTTLAKDLAQGMQGGVVFAAFTGKAALVMSRKGCNPSSTIHKLIYKPYEDPVTGDMKFRLRPRDDLEGVRLIIIDECSMVSEQIGLDLRSYGVPILVLGDPAQLPPVDGAGYFTENCTPDIMLTEIHRQAEGNPIIHLATLARKAEALPLGSTKTDLGAVSVVSEIKDGTLLAADQVICGTNKTRKALNARMRRLLFENGQLPSIDRKPQGHKPVVGDRVICLKNRHDRGLMNGSLWFITAISDRDPNARKPGRPDVVYMRLKSADDPNQFNEIHASAPLRYFDSDSSIKQKLEKDERGIDEFDFGYAITCHKSQGSQWDKVLVYDEGRVFREDAARWVYTAVTRAAEKLIVVVGV